MAKTRVFMGAVILVLLLQIFHNPVTSYYDNSAEMAQSSTKSSGVDIEPIEFKFSYTDSQDTADYGLLSSADLSSGTTTVTRPTWMWIIDGMLGKSQTIALTIANNGQVSSGVFDVEVIVKHNEYVDFYIYEGIHQVSNIGAGGSANIQFSWVPDYAGNHTIVARSLHAQDDNCGMHRQERVASSHRGRSTNC